MKGKWAVLFTWVFLSSIVGLIQPSSADIAPATTRPSTRPSASEQTLRRHVEYLASDALEGRVSEGPGAEKAVEYITEQFRRTGLQRLPGWRDYVQAGRVQFLWSERRIDVKNVVACLPGAGARADEIIIIGAHYDHLGRDQAGQIYRGADDNASGTAAILELARLFSAAGAQPRTLVFVAFGGEEWGMLGSKYFAQHLPFAQERVAAMVNFDMVGRSRLNTVLVMATGTAPEFTPILQHAKPLSTLAVVPMGSDMGGQSDHRSFINAGIPAIFFCTGPHGDMHTISDLPDRINYAGEAKIVDLAFAVISELARVEKPHFVAATTQPATQPTQSGMLHLLQKAFTK